MTFSALNKREQAHAVNVNFGNAVSVAARQVPSTGGGFGSSTSDIARTLQDYTGTGTREDCY